LRYEDFATDLRSTAELIGSLLELRLDPDAVQPERPVNHVTSRSVEESVGRWRRELDRDSAERIWRSLASRLEALGYTHD
jgi:hypothetical protein